MYSAVYDWWFDGAVDAVLLCTATLLCALNRGGTPWLFAAQTHRRYVRYWRARCTYKTDYNSTENMRLKTTDDDREYQVRGRFWLRSRMAAGRHGF